MNAVDHYAILGVKPESSRLEVRAAYRTLARHQHPDHGGSAEKMAALNAAWAVLGDPRKRLIYDRERVERIAREAILGASRRSMSIREIDALTKPIHRRSTRPEDGGSATVLDFGRYGGWPLTRIAQVDPDYLEWLAGVPAGQRIRGEIEAVINGQLRRRGTPAKWREVTPLRR